MENTTFIQQDKLQKVTVFGAGLLVGTALAVIIPEGVRALFSEHSKPTTITKDFTASPSEHDVEDLHSVIGIALVLGKTELEIFFNGFFPQVIICVFDIH